MATITDANGSSTTLTGTKTNDTIDASGADATMSAQNINSGNANDTIFRGGGDDRINGGAGIDTAVYTSSIDTTQFSWSGNTLIVNSGTGGAGIDQLVNVEWLWFGAKKKADGTWDTTSGQKIGAFGAIAKTDYAATEENSPVSLDVLANDSSLKAGAIVSVLNNNGQSLAAGESVICEGFSTSGKKVTATLDASGKLSFDPGTTFDYLQAGKTEVVTIHYRISNGTLDPDGKPSYTIGTAEITITGTNDAPVVAAALTDAATEGGALFTRNLLAGASDKDDGETATLTVANVHLRGGRDRCGCDGAGRREPGRAHPDR